MFCLTRKNNIAYYNRENLRNNTQTPKFDVIYRLDRINNYKCVSCIMRELLKLFKIFEVTNTINQREITNTDSKLIIPYNIELNILSCDVQLILVICN